ncbi:A24 family peptidase C-terminal domain-containing protein [Haladaptatus sp. AB643]|uniref:A24 family peptidase C-terminal domain-containing protein n=1 Tax=unclassified Haladaptatus TaxID=2622732 RepID=UPI00209C03C7|nr:prepilin peptidase [Haladaptatus sp. AB643]MCO8252229.1 prepilin peptidase [Haladaptatus sp. AB618]
MHTSIPDLLRLLAVPVFGWAAWRDVKTRRVPNKTWYPLAALAAVLLVWDGVTAMGSSPFQRKLFLFHVAVSLGFVAPLVVAFWWFRAFGGADMKAFLVVAALFPSYPTYYLGSQSYPMQGTVLGVFSLTILTNTVLLGALYPAALFVTNLATGRLSSVMFVGRVVDWDEIPTAHGRLLETPDEVTRNGVDLDAIRMYLRWRGATLADLRNGANDLRDPASLPAESNPPTDGMVTDGGTVIERERTVESGGYEDPWGAAHFLDSIDHGAYGTTPKKLRDGLEVLVTKDEMWVSPGIPFIVPLFVGLVVALGYGDILSGALAVLGLATI